jgi:AcrR family transcriptional regulator
MSGRPQKSQRDPERTKSRILAAALHEFARHGFAGARVDTIARRARTNKRMLYHYFTDKDGLFCAVLRHKINERVQQVGRAAHQTGKSELTLWFEQNCHDTEWVRLLAWESLQCSNDKIMDEAERRRHVRAGVKRIRQKQAGGELLNGVEPGLLQLTLAALAMFPLAMPQLTRLIVGCTPQNQRFQKKYAAFLETIAGRLRG